MITTTLRKIRAEIPCKTGWERLLRFLSKTKADDDLIPFSIIVASNGLDDALWCCRASPEYEKEWRLFAVWCSRQIKDLSTNPALDIAERYAHGLATISELEIEHANTSRDFYGGAVWGATHPTAWVASRSSYRAMEQSAFKRNKSKFDIGDMSREEILMDTARLKAVVSARDEFLRVVGVQDFTFIQDHGIIFLD